MKVYKGTDMNMRCRGKQYAIGEVVAEEDAGLRKKSLHACEMPLDVFKYYPPSESRFFEAYAEDVSDERGEDSKIVAGKMTLKAELSIAGIVKAQIAYVKEKNGCDVTIEKASHRKESRATGDYGAAAATGDYGAAAATGDRGAAAATGDQGAASATGYRGAAAATGYQGAASATCDCGAAAATGCQGAASATCDCGAAAATGYRGAAASTGYRGAAASTGDYGAAAATGYQGAAAATGYQGAASATGKACVAITAGVEGKAMGSIGNAICCVERGEWNGKTCPIIAIKAAIVDGKTIKENTWYTLQNGNFAEVVEE